MRAAVFHGRRDIRLDDVPEPEVPPPGGPHPITGETLPLTLGHEFAGSVGTAASRPRASSPSASGCPTASSTRSWTTRTAT
jgi:hypothetical protein